MRESTHYGLNLVEGDDLVNPLVQDVPNYEAIDEAMHNNAVASVGVATELVSGTVHAITRTNLDSDVFRFTATSNFQAGETFTVDGAQVTALTPSGEALTTGCYIIGSEVLCAIRDTLLTVYVSGVSTSENALKLDGHEASYFAVATDLVAVRTTANSAGQVADSANTKATNLQSNLTASGTKFIYDYQNGKFGYNTSETRGADTFHPFSSGFDISDFEIANTSGSASSSTTTSYTFTRKPKLIVITGAVGSATSNVQVSSATYIPNASTYVHTVTGVSSVTSTTKNVGDTVNRSGIMSWNDSTNTISFTRYFHTKVSILSFY